jgi:hypothetical protein
MVRRFESVRTKGCNKYNNKSIGIDYTGFGTGGTIWLIVLINNLLG